MAGRDPALGPVLADLREDAKELARIVDEMLDLASLDAPTPGQCVALDAARAVAANARIVSSGIGIEVEGDPAVRVGIPGPVLERTLLALVSNAVSFAPEGSTVRMTVGPSTRSGACLIRVIDRGPGISGIDPESLFDRFARGRGRATGASTPRSSHGIGLALVKEIARRYGGDARVEATGPEGTTMLLDLPTPHAGAVAGGGVQ